MSVTKFEDQTEGQLREIVADGISFLQNFSGLQKFLRRRRWRNVSDAAACAKKLGVIVTAHCENAELVGRLQQGLLAEGKTGPEWHEPSRPEAVEAEGTHRFATFLETPAPPGTWFIFPASARCTRPLAPKTRGVRLWSNPSCRICLLDKTYAERPGVEGMKHVMSPPLRDRAQSEGSCGTRSHAGLIDTVATDHCPFDTAQKLLGKDAFTQIPNGIPGIEERVNLLYTYGVKRGNAQICTASSMRPARVRRSSSVCFRAKGQSPSAATRIWSIYDPAYRGIISAANQHVNNDYSGFEGFEIDGRPQS